MFEVGFLELVDFVPLRADACLAGALLAAPGVAFVVAFLAGDLLVPGLAAAALGDPARVATSRIAAGGVAGFVTTAAGAGCVVLDPKAAWTVAKASSSESWRVSTVTFIRCSWPGKVAMSGRSVP